MSRLATAFWKGVHILGISGSLNPTSSNSALLRAMVTAVPTQLSLWDGLGALPHFRPDDNGDDHVNSLRSALSRADAVVIATPEYAGGMPGSLKNALDWLVGSGDLYGKPVAVVSAAPSPERGGRARAWVEDVVAMQGGQVVTSFTVTPGDDPHAVLARVVEALNACADCLAASS